MIDPNYSNYAAAHLLTVLLYMVELVERENLADKMAKQRVEVFLSKILILVFLNFLSLPCYSLFFRRVLA